MYNYWHFKRISMTINTRTAVFAPTWFWMTSFTRTSNSSHNLLPTPSELLRILKAPMLFILQSTLSASFAPYTQARFLIPRMLVPLCIPFTIAMSFNWSTTAEKPSPRFQYHTTHDTVKNNWRGLRLLSLLSPAADRRSRQQDSVCAALHSRLSVCRWKFRKQKLTGRFSSHRQCLFWWTLRRFSATTRTRASKRPLCSSPPVFN